MSNMMTTQAKHLLGVICSVCLQDSNSVTNTAKSTFLINAVLSQSLFEYTLVFTHFSNPGNRVTQLRYQRPSLDTAQHERLRNLSMSLKWLRLSASSTGEFGCCIVQICCEC